jgi:hypothetical protein
MEQRLDKTIIVRLTDAQRQHLDLVTGSTGVTISEVVRMGIGILTPEIVREVKISELKKQAEEMSQGKPIDRAQLPLIKPKRRYRHKKKRAGVTTTSPQNEVDKVGPFSPSSPRK